MAKAAAPYLHPRLSSIEHSGEQRVLASELSDDDPNPVIENFDPTGGYPRYARRGDYDFFAAHSAVKVPTLTWKKAPAEADSGDYRALT
jgi:hypothetical protein